MLYIDSDGPAADWRGYVLRHHLPEAKCIDELNKHKHRNRILTSIYKKDPHLFYNLPAVESFVPIITYLRNSNIPFKILTAIDKHPNHKQAAADKMHWWADMFEVCRDDVIVVATSLEKTTYAKGNILIDDWDKNCNSWNDAGGTSIHIDAIDGVYDPVPIIRKLELLCK